MTQLFFCDLAEYLLRFNVGKGKEAATGKRRETKQSWERFSGSFEVKLYFFFFPPDDEFQSFSFLNFAAKPENAALTAGLPTAVLPLIAGTHTV